MQRRLHTARAGSVRHLSSLGTENRATATPLCCCKSVSSIVTASSADADPILLCCSSSCIAERCDSLTCTQFMSYWACHKGAVTRAISAHLDLKVPCTQCSAAGMERTLSGEM